MNKDMGVIQKTYHFKVSKKYNEKLESLLKHIKTVEPLARIKKQSLIELGIQNLTENDALSVAKQNINRKALVLEYLKSDKNLANPKALIKLLNDQTVSS